MIDRPHQHQAFLGHFVRAPALCSLVVAALVGANCGGDVVFDIDDRGGSGHSQGNAGGAGGGSSSTGGFGGVGAGDVGTTSVFFAEASSSVQVGEAVSVSSASSSTAAASSSTATGSSLPPDVACWQSTVGPPIQPPYGVDAGSGETKCSMVGTWDVVPSMLQFPAPPMALSFDDTGRFVLGSPGADLCQDHVQSGNYSLRATMLLIWNQQGSGVLSCALAPIGVAGYTPQFSLDCSTLELSVVLDECTGSGLFRDGGTLKRRD